MESVLSKNGTGDGIEPYDNYVRLIGNRLDNNWEHGIHFTGAKKATAIGNQVTKTQYHGQIAVWCDSTETTEDILFANNIVKNAPTKGINFASAGDTKDIIIANNTVKGHYKGNETAPGITIKPNSDGSLIENVNVIGNVVKDNGDWPDGSAGDQEPGIKIGGPKTKLVSIEGNIVSLSNRQGIHILSTRVGGSYVKHISVKDNLVYNNNQGDFSTGTGDGIHISSGNVADSHKSIIVRGNSVISDATPMHYRSIETVFNVSISDIHILDNFTKGAQKGLRILDDGANPSTKINGQQN